MKTLITILLLTLGASAQTVQVHTEAAVTPALRTYTALSDAPSHVRAQLEKKPNIFLAPFKDPAFYIGVGNHTASAIVDVHSTQACIANKTCVEAYPGHERYRYVAPLIALEAGAQYGCSLMLSGHKKWRWGCLGISAAMSFYHWKDASTIYHNDRTAKP